MDFSPARMGIYALARNDFSQEAVYRLAQRFGLAGGIEAGRFIQDARRAVYLEGNYELVVHAASGGLRFHDVTRWQADDGTANVSYDDETAAVEARKVVERYGLAAEDEYRLLRVTRLTAGLADQETGYTEERVIDVGVSFQRLVNGLPVLGPGGKMMVYLDHTGAFTGVDYLWRTISGQIADGPELRPREEVEREFAHERPSVTPESIDFGYFEAGWDTGQEFLQPVYRLPFAITGPHGRTVMRSDYLATAAVEPPEPLFASGPVFEPQPQNRAGA
jgi:hypothetical protein